MAQTVFDSHPSSAHDAPISLGNNIFLYAASQRADHKCWQDQQPRLDARTELKTRTEAGPTAAVGPPSTSPTLIVLCTWLGGATTRRVNHYVAGYRRHYPHAEILLIRTVFLDISVRSFATILARLEPALDAIRQILPHQTGSEKRSPTASISPVEENNPSRRDVLLHVFSHGGCNTSLQLMAALPPDERARFHARLRLLVLDCCPGDASFQRAYEAALLSLPPAIPPSLRTLGAAGVYGVVGVVHALQASGVMRSVRDLRHGLNEPGFAGRGARRLYLFSDGDRAVAPGDVISHARAAEEAGYPAEMARFGGAAHCALIVEDAARYWGVICSEWDRQGSTSGSENPGEAVDLLPLSKL